MPDYRQLVDPATALVIEGPIIASWNSLQVILPRGARFNSEGAHHAAPFFSMWFDAVKSIQAIDDIMRHLMRDCIAQAFLVMFGEHPGVVANTLRTTVNLVHTGASSAQIEVDLRRFHGGVIHT